MTLMRLITINYFNRLTALVNIHTEYLNKYIMEIQKHILCNKYVYNHFYKEQHEGLEMSNNDCLSVRLKLWRHRVCSYLREHEGCTTQSVEVAEQAGGTKRESNSTPSDEDYLVHDC